MSFKIDVIGLYVQSIDHRTLKMFRNFSEAFIWLVTYPHTCLLYNVVISYKRVNVHKWWVQWKTQTHIVNSNTLYLPTHKSHHSHNYIPQQCPLWQGGGTEEGVHQCDSVDRSEQKKGSNNIRKKYIILLIDTIHIQK